MQRLALVTAVLIAGSGLTGCATQQIIPEPGKITLEAAMAEVAAGLNNMYDIRKDHPKSGLVPSEVTIVFNVSASAKDEGKLYIEAGATTADVLKIGKAGAEVGSKIESARGNQVTIKFSNLLFAPKDTYVTTKDPGDIGKLLKALKEAGAEPLMIK